MSVKSSVDIQNINILYRDKVLRNKNIYSRAKETFSGLSIFFRILENIENIL